MKRTVTIIPAQAERIERVEDITLNYGNVVVIPDWGAYLFVKDIMGLRCPTLLNLKGKTHLNECSNADNSLKALIGHTVIKEWDSILVYDNFEEYARATYGSPNKS